MPNHLAGLNNEVFMSNPELHDDLKALHALVADLKVEITHLQLVNSDLQTQVDDLTDKIKIITHNYCETHEQLAVQIEKNTQLTYQNNHLMNDLEALNDKLKVLEAINIEDKNILADTLEVVTSLQAEATSLKGKNSLLQKEVTIVIAAANQQINALKRTSKIPSTSKTFITSQLPGK